MEINSMGLYYIRTIYIYRLYIRLKLQNHFQIHSRYHLHLSTPLVTNLTMKVGNRRASCGNPGTWVWPWGTARLVPQAVAPQNGGEFGGCGNVLEPARNLPI